MKLYWHICQLLTIPGLRLGLLTALAILTLWQAAADSSGVWQQYRQQQAELATFAQWPEVKSDLHGKINHLRRENASAGAEIFALFDANSYFAEKLRLCQEKGLQIQAFQQGDVALQTHRAALFSELQLQGEPDKLLTMLADFEQSANPLRIREIVFQPLPRRRQVEMRMAVEVIFKR
jgi:hypothetical protein